MANVAIILVAAVLCAVLIKQYVLPASPNPPPSQVQRKQVSKGDKISVPGVDWGQSGQTLLMALSTGCHYCTESAPFYQRLSRERAGKSVRLVALFPQQTDESRQYLNGLGVTVDEVQQVSPGAVDVPGTPTLILVDGQGTVRNVWVGKLSEGKEVEVFASL
ncbi:MAG: hypothetical protein ABW208_27440 [Pyrinomonadaceae bacterium]